MHVITFSNSKGGVAKSTTSVNMASALVRKGFRVLLVDIDSQASASMYLGLTPGTKDQSELNNYSIADCLYRGVTVNNIIIELKSKLSILRGSKELSLLDLHLAHIHDWYYELSRLLEIVDDKYDFAIIDTPPSLNPTTINALVASDSIVVVSPPLSLDVSSLKNFLRELTEIRKLAPIGFIKGILITRTRRLKTMEAHTKYLREEFEELVFDTEIKESVVIPESAANKLSVFDYKPRSASAKQYESFCKELLIRIL